MEISIDTWSRLTAAFVQKIKNYPENFWIKLCVQSAGVYMEISIDMLQLILKSI